MTNNLKIIPFEPEKHFSEVYELWQTNFGESWPLDRETFTRLLAASELNDGLTTYPYAAFMEATLVGFVTIQITTKAATPTGIINLLLVSPQFQRQGIGSALHNYIWELFEQAGVTKAQLGGGNPTIWQGVPVELDGAAAFFNKMGWEFSAKSFDLIQDLQNFQDSQEFIGPVEAREIIFDLATPADREAILAFQKKEFPHWLVFYEQLVELGDYRDILLVKDAEASLLGMLMMYSTSSNPRRLDVVWKGIHGENVGAIGAVGIAPKAHRQGLGTAMMAFANEVQKARGVGICFISWTRRVTFYERLGYKLWKSYHMSWRSLL